jgi:predicted O-linked N-acetylglucosamine transferase (SPINDLY family)
MPSPNAEPGRNNVIALVQQAMAHQQAGRLEDAEAHYKRALAIDPNQFEALHFLGLLEAQRGNLVEADRLVERSLSIYGQRAEAHSNHARILRQMGRPRDAITRCDRALTINPFLVDALLLRGNALRDLGRLTEAVVTFDRALSVNPNEPLAHYNRGLTLTLAWGSEKGALASLEQALAARPRDPDFLVGRARALAALLQQDEALRSLDEALAIRPDDVEALLGRGDTLHRMGRWQEALASYDRACALQPDNVRARLALCMGQLPVIYETEGQIDERREAYRRQLHDLCAYLEQRDALAAFAKVAGNHLPFFLAYQGRNDRDLQKQFGALVCRAMSAQQPSVPLAPPAAVSERMRIGIVSGYFCRHTVWRIMIKGWLTQLDRRQFEVFGYHTTAMRDLQTETAEELCEHFVQGPKLIDDWRDTIAADAPHVLLYPEINMDAAAAALAALRLAPVQCMSWGHPETSGYPTIDYFLSSELMEPPDGDAHHNERLVRLPNLSVYYEPFEVTPAQTSRQELGLRPGAVVFWCGQSLFKYLPQDDDVYPRIAQAAPDCQFVFLEHPNGKSATEVFRKRLERVFAAHGLAATDHLVILPRLLFPEFVAAIGQCDIVLDSIGWSGFTSTLDGFHHDHPVVTLAGALMRGRHTMAILSMMGVTETIARTVDEYVAIAQRLATDAAWRNAIKERMRATKHRVYRDRACIDALEDFLLRVARDRRAGS